jgi:protein-L-isoaspartate O-methyltransferase
MSNCPRAHFVPRRHLGEAYVDTPIRVEQHGFNISAPHMHAATLEAMDITEGDRCPLSPPPPSIPR